MSTLDDLRQTLDRHAADVTDAELPVRADLVRGRVRVARRRRQGAVVAAAVAVVGAISVGVVAGGGTTPQLAGQPDRSLGDHTAPATIESLGWTYDYATGETGQNTAEIHLDASDEPRLISWATPDASVKVVREAGDPGDKRVWVSGQTGFDDFTTLPPGQAATYRAYADDVALAVYELDGDGSDFRPDVAGATLLGSTSGEPGVAELNLAISADHGKVALAFHCAGGEGGYEHLSVNGEEVSFGRGCSDPVFDPGASPELSGPMPGRLRLRLWVTDGRNGSALEDDDVRLQLGVYKLAKAYDHLAGYDVPVAIEFDGHVWYNGATASGSPGARGISGQTEKGVPTLVQLLWNRSGDAVVKPTVEGRPTGDQFVTGGGVATISDFYITDGSDVGAILTGPRSPGVELALAYYGRAD